MRDKKDIGLELPPELVLLDRELSSITIEERPSFGPELEAELEREWAEPVAERRAFRLTHAVAAGVGALMLMGLSAPARASIARLLNVGAEATVEVAVPARPNAVPSVDVDRVTDAPVVDLSAPIEGSSEARGVPPATVLPRRAPSDVVFPELLNREEYQRSIAERYPQTFTEAGLGGTVRIRLWVNQNGGVEYVQVAETSGIEILDRFAIEVATDLRFSPARRASMGVGTWVELPLVFSAGGVNFGGRDRPAVIASPVPPIDTEMRLPASFVPGVFVTPPPSTVEAESLLRASLGAGAMPGGQWETTLGALLAGEPPAGVRPIRWRESATVALENAMQDSPDNPAPMLALARIRRKQGLWAEARRLYEQGIQRANRFDGGISTALLSELHYERGKIVQQEWLAWSDLGLIPSAALRDSSCSAPRAETSDGQVGTDVLIAWNYLCSSALDRIMDESFEPILPPGSQRRQEMLRSFHAVVRNAPAHVGANREILLDLADRRRWNELLDAAQRFVVASEGHPEALLMSGLALQRLGYSAQAFERMEIALSALPEEDALALENISALQASRRTYNDQYPTVAMSRRERERVFWASNDPVLFTGVNERRVEHLARGAYALLKFGDLRDAAANVVIRYGLPIRVRAFGEDASSRTVFWGYETGPDVTFRRAVGSDHLDMTAEAVEYLDDLLESRPHRFGFAGAAMIQRLPGQAALFRENGTEGWEVDIHNVMPDEFAALDDFVDMTIFVLGSDGERLSESTSTVHTSTHTLRNSIGVGAGATEMAIELYHGPTGMIALMRSPLRARRADGASRISDVLFIEPARPRLQSLTRQNDWMQPVTTSGVDADEVGMLFEVYGLTSGREQYSVEVFLTGPDGATRTMPVRNAYDDEFGASWVGVSRRERPVTQFLVIDISNVEPGMYTVGLVAALPGVSLPAVSKKRLVIR